jgi:hypothetical protein
MEATTIEALRLRRLDAMPVQQEKRVYVTQYGFYWSMPHSKWAEICKRMSTDRNANYDYDKEARLLKHKPTSIIPELIHKTLDWQVDEWRDALYDETQIMICALCSNETEHEPDEQCSECGGCEHCCMGDSFRECEFTEED